MRSKINKYRLRDNHTIVGYAEGTPEGVLFTSKYPQLWRNNKEDYNYVDEATGILDKLNRMIYEYDIVSYKINHRRMRREGIVLWSDEKNAFGIFDVISQHFSFFFVDKIFLFNREKVEVVSHAFNRPELMEKFKL